MVISNKQKLGIKIYPVCDQCSDNTLADRMKS